MKILVIVREVAKIEDGFTVDGTSVADAYFEYDLNEWDDYAIESAVQIAENTPAVETVGVTIGPERAEETVRMALAKGLDRAIRVWDDALESVTDIATRPTTQILKRVVAQEDPDLVLTGVQASDDASGVTGVSLADAVGFEHAAVVNDIELQEESQMVSVRQELEGGLEQLVDVELPAVLTIQAGTNEPRYASLRGIRQAREKEIAVTTLAELGLSASDMASALTLTKMYKPKSNSDPQILDGNPEKTTTELASTLREMGVGQ